MQHCINDKLKPFHKSIHQEALQFVTITNEAVRSGRLGIALHWPSEERLSCSLFNKALMHSGVSSHCTQYRSNASHPSLFLFPQMYFILMSCKSHCGKTHNTLFPHLSKSSFEFPPAECCSLCRKMEGSIPCQGLCAID